MLTGRKLAECIHLTALAIWLGAMLMGGGVAAFVFPTMASLDPQLASYAAYPESHGVIVAGFIGEFIFFVLDATGLLAIFVAIVSLVTAAVYRMSLRRISTLVRASCLGLAMMALAYQLLSIAPQMKMYLDEFRMAAQAGELEAAAQARAAFRELHPLSSNVLAVTVLAVLGAFVSGVWSACTGSCTTPLPNQPVLEDPALLTTPL